MKNWRNKNKPKDEFEPTWDWKVRKQPDYCRPHGRRIIILLNGVGGCRKCVEQAILKLKKQLPAGHPLKMEN
jgi:hypothetical protein